VVDHIAVETNWILDVVLQRDDGSRRLWHLAEQGDLTIYLPAICLAESVKWLETQVRTWQKLADDLTRAVGDIRRSELLIDFAAPLAGAQAGLVQLQDTTRAEIWNVLERIIGGGIRLMETSTSMIARALAIQTQLTLSPADALVLATVVESRSAGTLDSFMSRDHRAFDKPEVRRYMETFGIAYFPNARAFLRAMRRRPADR